MSNATTLPVNGTKATPETKATEIKPTEIKPTEIKAPVLDPKEQARRERVVAREAARKASEAAREASTKAREATMLALNAALGKGTKVKARNAARTMTPDEIHAALVAASETGSDVRVSISIPATETRDGRRYGVRLASED